MGYIKNLRDVVEWQLCIGCGACFSVCPYKSITLKNIKNQGIRPIIDERSCEKGCTDCRDICPGVLVNACLNKEGIIDQSGDESLFGPVLEIWEGYANDEEIRYNASSGGILTALALFGLESGKVNNIVHTGMSPEYPLQNKTIMSRTRQDLIKHAGSRYLTSSPCDSFGLIEKGNQPSLFIGKPCDSSALLQTRKSREVLDKNVAISLSFFCAGVPNQEGLKDLLNEMDILPDKVNNLRFRGRGWPGNFHVSSEKNEKSMSYKDSWHKLQKYRSLRCHLCPDGLGQMADISCGDAWHKYKSNGNPGMSIILIRTEKGRTFFHEAVKAGYLKITPSSTNSVIKAQGLLKRKPEIFGRLIARKLFLLPIPKYKGMLLYKSWCKLNFLQKMKSILGSIKRIIIKNWWRRREI